MLGYDQHCRKFTLKARKNSVMSTLCRILLCEEPIGSDACRINAGAYRIDGVPCRKLSGRYGRMERVTTPRRPALSRPKRRLAIAALALAVGAALSACTSGSASSPAGPTAPGDSASAAVGAPGGDGAGT